VLIGWVNPCWAADVADRCQQLYKRENFKLTHWILAVLSAGILSLVLKAFF
jgi:hypothetical protein